MFMDNNEDKKLKQSEFEFVDDKTAAILLNTPSNARILLWILLLFVVIAIAWANWAGIDKVTVGQGKVIPSSQVQVQQEKLNNVQDELSALTESTVGLQGELPIIPGMTASVDIITGKRTLLDYLLKPILSTGSNALKE